MYQLFLFPALVSTKVGSTNFSRVLAYSRTFAYCVLRTAYCDFHPDPCSGTAKNHVFGRNTELLYQNRAPLQADPRRTHLRPSCELQEDRMSSFCARSANVTARRALAHDIALPFYYQYTSVQYTINTVQYPTGKNKKEGTDTLTLVNVFILYTHCHKYRIYF